MSKEVSRRRRVDGKSSFYFVCDVHGWDYTDEEGDVCPVCTGESIYHNQAVAKIDEFINNSDKPEIADALEWLKASLPEAGDGQYQHACRNYEGHLGCISCYAIGEDQGVETAVNLISRHKLFGFKLGEGFICSCSPDRPVGDYSNHLHNLLHGEETESFIVLEDLIVNDKHKPTGRSVAGFLGVCSCGEAVDDFNTHVRESSDE